VDFDPKYCGKYRRIGKIAYINSKRPRFKGSLLRYQSYGGQAGFRVRRGTKGTIKIECVTRRKGIEGVWIDIF
jgi:hypothetical protein